MGTVGEPVRIGRIRRTGLDERRGAVADAGSLARRRIGGLAQRRKDAEREKSGSREIAGGLAQRRKDAEREKSGSREIAGGLAQRRKDAELDEEGGVEAVVEGRRLRLEVVAPAEAVMPSARMVEVGLRFGIPMMENGRRIAAGVELAFAPGRIILITGPSGAGKTLLLNRIGRHFPNARWVNRLPFPLDVAVVDAVAPGRPMAEAMSLLTAAGLGEPMLWMRRFAQLSEGEQFRARLARAVSLQPREGGCTPLLCDEFGSLLHRRLARAVAFNLRKRVSRDKLFLVVSTSRDDLTDALRPDRIVRLDRDGGAVVETPTDGAHSSAGAAELFGDLRIERGTLADYARFAAMHYRHQESAGFVDRVFVLREGHGGEALGVVVYGRPVLELALRNQATGRRFVRQPRLLNREMRVLKRLVVHPDARGCGLGHWLVRRTLPEAGTRFVECLAAMGAINPVFEKAGMRRIGTCLAPVARDAALRALRKAGVDPLAADFVAQVCRRPTVRRLVRERVRVWYRGATAGGGESRVERQTPTQLARTFRQLVGSEPVYLLWGRESDDWALIEARGGESVRNI